MPSEVDSWFKTVQKKAGKRIMNMGKKTFILEDNGCIDDAWQLIKDENKSQVKKWGFQKHDVYCWLGFLTEELGELSQAISEYVYRDGDVDDIAKEAIQVATLAAKMAMMVKEIKSPERNGR